MASSGIVQLQTPTVTAGLELSSGDAQSDPSLRRKRQVGAMPPIEVTGVQHGSCKLRATIRQRWIATYLANAIVELFTGVGLLIWGLGAVSAPRLCTAGLCGIVTGVGLTILAALCAGSAYCAHARSDQLPAWWPNRSSLLLRGILWAARVLLVSGMKRTSCETHPAASMHYQAPYSPSEQEHETDNVKSLVHSGVCATYSGFRTGIITKSGSPVVRHVGAGEIVRGPMALVRRGRLA